MIQRPRGLGLLAALIAGLLLAAEPPAAQAQSGSFFNQRDDEYTLLGLKRAKDAFEVASAQLARRKALFDAGLLAAEELDGARRMLSDAEVNYQQSLLAAIFENQYVAVTSAVKLRSGGDKRVRLTLENTSGGGAEIEHLVGVDSKLFEAMRPEVVHDVYVALANDEGAVVSQPYEVKLEELRFGAPRNVELALLQDLDEVTVMLTFGRGSQRSIKVFLEKDSSVDRVVIDSEQFSQEVELGAAAGFDLSLELFSGSSDTYKLEVVGLPDEIDRYFEDGASRARMSQLKFTEGARTRRASLRVTLPDRPSAAVPIGSPLPFWALVVPRDRLAELGDLTRIDPNADAFAALGVGAVRLELVARGVGSLRARAPQLFFPIAPDGVVEATVELVNEGTRRLDNLEVKVDAPLGWEEEVEPALVARLEVAEKAKVTVRLRPPAGVPVGRYEARVKSTSFADEKAIEGEDKTLTIEIQPTTRLAPSAILAAAMVLLVLGVVGVGIRLARR